MYKEGKDVEIGKLGTLYGKDKDDVAYVDRYRVRTDNSYSVSITDSHGSVIILDAQQVFQLMNALMREVRVEWKNLGINVMEL